MYLGTCSQCCRPGSVVNSLGYCRTCDMGIGNASPEHVAAYNAHVAASRPIYEAGYWHGLAIGMAFGAIAGLVVAVLVFHHVWSL